MSYQIFSIHVYIILQPPQRITLGHRSARRRAGTTYKEVLKNDEMMCIPILASLKQMLDQDDILSHVG